MYQQNGHIVLAITAHTLFAALSLKCQDAAATVRVTEKLLLACVVLADVAKTNHVLAEYLMRTYRTTDLVAWTVNDRKTSQHHNRALLRENADYMALLDRFDK